MLLANVLRWYSRCGLHNLYEPDTRLCLHIEWYRLVLAVKVHLLCRLWIS